MYLIGHAAIGMTLAAGTNEPVLAFGIGWLSHYLADLIPHGDEDAGEWVKRGHEVKRLLALVGIDSMLLLAAYAWFVAHRGFSPAPLAAALGSAIPDVMWGLEKVFKRNLFGWHERLHHKNHNYFRVRMPLWAGLAFQGALTALLWYRLTLG
ncbi:MAG: hypothetical protein RL272_870 [Candidatus Parcubacteria bacterium]|jgi:hypothetical protein